MKLMWQKCQIIQLVSNLTLLAIDININFYSRSKFHQIAISYESQQFP